MNRNWRNKLKKKECPEQKKRIPTSCGRKEQRGKNGAK